MSDDTAAKAKTARDAAFAKHAADRSNKAIAEDLRDLANGIDEALEAAAQNYGRQMLGIVLVEYQLNKRDPGQESRLLREAADELDPPQEEQS